MKIVERSNGYWIIDADSVIDGPFFELSDAMETLAIMKSVE